MVIKKGQLTLKLSCRHRRRYELGDKTRMKNGHVPPRGTRSVPAPCSASGRLRFEGTDDHKIWYMQIAVLFAEHGNPFCREGRLNHPADRTAQLDNKVEIGA